MILDYTFVKIDQKMYLLPGGSENPGCMRRRWNVFTQRDRIPQLPQVHYRFGGEVRIDGSSTWGRRSVFLVCCLGPAAREIFMKNRTSPRGRRLSCVLGLHVFSMAYTGFSTLPCHRQTTKNDGLPHGAAKPQPNQRRMFLRAATRASYFLNEPVCAQQSEFAADRGELPASTF